MGLSRRMFTKEFKLAAVQRLERGSSLGEVARALEVNPNVLHRWRREVRQGPGNVFPGHGKQRWAEGRIADLERKIGALHSPEYPGRAGGIHTFDLGDARSGTRPAC
jgi:transposase